jgi:hypothetical protein
LPIDLNFIVVAGYFPPPYFMGPPQQLGPKAGDDRNTSDPKKDVEISKEQKSSDVEKVEPK